MQRRWDAHKEGGMRSVKTCPILSQLKTAWSIFVFSILLPTVSFANCTTDLTRATKDATHGLLNSVEKDHPANSTLGVSLTEILDALERLEKELEIIPDIFRSATATQMTRDFIFSKDVFVFSYEDYLAHQKMVKVLSQPIHKFISRDLENSNKFKLDVFLHFEDRCGSTLYFLPVSQSDFIRGPECGDPLFKSLISNLEATLKRLQVVRGILHKKGKIEEFDSYIKTIQTTLNTLGITLSFEKGNLQNRIRPGYLRHAEDFIGLTDSLTEIYDRSPNIFSETMMIRYMELYEEYMKVCEPRIYSKMIQY